LAGVLAATVAGPAIAHPVLSGARAYQLLRDQVAMGPRVPGSAAHERAIAYYVAALRRLTPAVSLEPFEADDGEHRLHLTNVVAVFGQGRGDPAMLAAHWDSRPRSERDPDRARRAMPTPGADDGASGVAVCLEVARALAGQTLPREVRIALWDGEDWGISLDTMFYGSRYYVSRHAADLPRWGILLDMVGGRHLRVPREAFGDERARGLADRVYRMADELGLARQFPDRSGPAIYDDHLPFLDHRVPFIDLIDFDSPHWHTTRDLPEDCAPESLERVARLAYEVLATPR
jgi:Zn-dependent M28 family amino/carboxypeptidase